jgi:hypothetical protein
VTLPVPTVPCPFVTTHSCVGPVGCAPIVTLYVAPLGSAVANVNEPLL